MMMKARSSSLYLLVLAGAFSRRGVVHSFSVIQGPASWVPQHYIENIFGTGGGRAAEQPDQLRTYDDDDDTQSRRWEPNPCEGSEARLIVLQITDVYV